MVTLLSGLPWTEGWATAFRVVRAEMGWMKSSQDWRGGIDLHAAHDHQGMSRRMRLPAVAAGLPLGTIAARAQREHMAFPALLSPPGAPARFGKANGAFWKLTSEAQNRSLIRTVRYDAMTGAVVGRDGFSDKHVVDRVINYGIAWHEGQLFGWVNQLIGLVTAAMLITLVVSGSVMWWRKRPEGRLGAPPQAQERRGIALALVCPLAILMPMLGLSLIAVWIVDRLVTAAFPRAAQWLGRT